MKFPFDQSHHLRAVGRLFAEGGRLGAVSGSWGSERLVGIRRWIISLVSIPTHYCMFLLFVFVYIYRRRIYWGTTLLRIRRHEILLKTAGSRHLPWSLNWKSWGIIWQIPSRPGARIAPVMSDWLVILEQFKGWWRYVGVCFLVGGVVNRAIRNLKFTEEITGSTFLFLQRTIRFSFHVFTGVYTTDIGVYAWIF